MLHDGQQLDVRESHVDDVVGELVRHLAIAQGAVVVRLHAPP